ncbi:MAG TPA: NAD-dependent epimerase/dehydratase family protein [Streptosporangiaceae bacterium]
MNVLVIGATGYIGSRVAAAFAGDHRVSSLRRPGGRPAAYPTVPGDLTDPASLAAAAAGFDLVVHAGVPVDAGTDLAGAEALVAAGSPLVYTTGAAVLGGGQADEDSPPDPHPLAAWRAEVERRVRAAGGRVIRPGMVYGHGGGLVHDLLAAKAAERGTGVYIGRPGVRWPVVHLDDLADLYLLVAEKAAPGTVWHGIAETVRLDRIAAALGGGSASSWPLHEAVAELGPLADLFTRDQTVSADKTRAALGWHPVHTSIVDELTTA